MQTELEIGIVLYFFIVFLAWKAKLVIAKIMEEMENDDEDDDDDDDESN